MGQSGRLKQIILGLVFLIQGSLAHAAPATSTISGTVYDGAGDAVSRAVITVRIPQQVVGGETVQSTLFTTRTSSAGVLTPFTLAQGAIGQVTVGRGMPVAIIVPATGTTTFADLLAGLISASSPGAITHNAGTLTTTGTGVTITGEWDAAGLVMGGLKVNFTDTASHSNSTLLDLQTDSTSVFKVGKSGIVTLAAVSHVLAGTMTGTYTLAGTPSLGANLAASAAYDITGLDEVGFADAGGGASAVGRLRRSGVNLSWHDGTAARNVAMRSDNLSVFASTTSAQLGSTLSDETGTGSAVFTNTPTIVTPVLSGTVTGTYTIGGTPTLPLISSTNYPATTSAQFAGVISNETGTGLLVLDTSPTLTTPVLSGTVTGTYTLGGTPTLPLISSTNYAATTSAQFAGVISNETGTGLVVLSTSPTFSTSILIGSAGVSIADDGDGAITFLGLGDGNDEDLTLNLDDIADTGTFTSSTSLATLNFSGIALQESGVGVLNADEIDASSELAAIMDDETGSGSLVFGTSPNLTTPTIGSGTSLSKVTVGDQADGSNGWDPDGATSDFTVTADAASIGATSLINVSLAANSAAVACSVYTRTASTSFQVKCGGNVDNGASLQYLIIN